MGCLCPTLEDKSNFWELEDNFPQSERERFDFFWFVSVYLESCVTSGSKVGPHSPVLVFGFRLFIVWRVFESNERIISFSCEHCPGVCVCVLEWSRETVPLV